MLITNIQNSRSHQWRRVWLNFHLYLGLSVGLVFVLAGLTGSLLVFYVEIDECLNPVLQISVDTTQQPKQPYETWLQALNQAHPERTGAWRIELPRDEQAMAVARYYKPEETKHLHFAPYMVWLNPYTADVVSSRFWGQTLMTWLYDLHYTLLLDKTGKLIMSIIGGVLLVLLLTGVYLWLPSPNKWRTALTLKRHSSYARLIFDVHKLNGVYGLVLLLLLVLTGILLELPDTFNPLINRVSPLYEMPKVASKPQNKARISVDEAVNIAVQQYPHAQLRWIETPNNAIGSYRIMLYQTGEPSLRFPKTMVWIEQYTGQVLAHKDARQSSAGDSFITWLHPLHSGEIAGLTGRWIIFISGFIPAVLYVTGFIRWRQKRAAKKPFSIR
ncbi:MAG: PepSY domain-containing protein [Methylococcales bacterium]